jgi:uncharacterized protein (UPF0335 family)
MLDWTTMIVTVGAANAGNFIGWFLFRRAIERMDSDKISLTARVDDLEDKRVAALEKEIRAEGQKRKDIYEHLEKIRLNWVAKKDCREWHAALTEQLRDYMAAVMKLERVSTEVTRLVGWVDEISKEQIGAGKDISALATEMRILYQKKEKNHDAG